MGMTAKYRFIDCHCHLLPNVDDGSYSLSLSQEAFRRLREQGCVGCVLTSHMCFGNRRGYHWFPPRERIEAACEELSAVSAPFPFRLGAEVNVQDAHSTLHGLRSGKLLSMAGSRFILAEFEPDADMDFILDGVKVLRGGGYEPVLAHPERLAAFMGHPENLELLAKENVPVQVNAYSLAREKKAPVREAARRALELRLIRWLGSDSHPPRRWPQLSEGLDYLYSHAPQDYADAVAFGNAERDFFTVKEK